MTREDIEKAAMLRFNIGEPTCGIDKFIEGANWRINSVWHDMNTMPNFNKLPILMKHKSGSIHFLDDRLTRRSYLKKHYVCWAYIRDLIPPPEE